MYNIIILRAQYLRKLWIWVYVENKIIVKCKKSSFLKMSYTRVTHYSMYYIMMYQCIMYETISNYYIIYTCIDVPISKLIF